MEERTDGLELNATPMGAEQLKTVAEARSDAMHAEWADRFMALSDEEQDAELEKERTAYEKTLIGIYGDNSPEVECFRHGRFVWCPLCAPHLVESKDALG